MNRYIKTHLHILQLEGYMPLRFMSWWLRHPLTFVTPQKKSLVITPKILLLLRLTYILYLLLILLSLFIPPFFILLAILLVEPFPLILLSLLLIQPYEIINRRRTIMLVSQQVKARPDLTVIGVTGSFGKTTTKDYLYQILRHHQSTIKTPQSYNTVFGISKVIDLELTSKTKYFICEMGAYVRGEIKELVSMAHPKYAILTAIGSQHLERFKSLSNTTRAKFELIDAVKPEYALVNLDNNLIADHLKLPQYKGAKTYSLHLPTADFFVSSYSLSTSGISFQLKTNLPHLKSNICDLRSPLFGTSNLQNLVAAVSMSLLLGVPEATIQSAVKGLKASPHRLEIKPFGTATLIDNAYSSNEEGFIQIVSDLKSLKGKKAILTPGIIELGNQTVDVHQRLGKLSANTFDKFILVGHSDRTTALEQGIKSVNADADIEYLTDHRNLWPTIDKLSKDFAWILLENDLPDNY